MEVIILVELALHSGIGKIQRLLRVHGHKYLHKGEQATKDTLRRVFLNLLASLGDRHTTPLQLNMDNRHAVNQEH